MGEGNNRIPVTFEGTIHHFNSSMQQLNFCGPDIHCMNSSNHYLNDLNICMDTYKPLSRETPPRQIRPAEAGYDTGGSI
jgi:hypothetical protein